MDDICTLRSVCPHIAPVEFDLGVGSFIVGRSSQCDFRVRHDSVSRRHAEIRRSSSEVMVADLGSSNGTFVEGTRIATAPLLVTQHVTFGVVEFMLIAPSVEDALGSEMETNKEKVPTTPLERARAKLSRAQGRILDLIAQGLSEKKIAGQLHLSVATVHNHIQAIYRSFKVHSRAELLLFLLGTKHADADSGPAHPGRRRPKSFPD